MITIKFEYDTKAALERGLARQGEGQIHLSDADVANMTPEQRTALPIGSYFTRLPDGTIDDLLVWVDNTITQAKTAAAERHCAEEVALGHANTWRAEVEEHLATNPKLNAINDFEIVGLPRRTYSVGFNYPVVAPIVDATNKRIADYRAPLAAQRRAQREAAEQAKKDAGTKAAAEQEAADLQWAKDNKGRCPLLTKHIDASVRGTQLRQATRQAQIEVELGDGWTPELNVPGDFGNTSRLPGVDEYNALDAAKNKHPDASIKCWKDYVACRHGGCPECDKDDEHPRCRWVLSATWRGETILKYIEP